MHSQINLFIPQERLYSLNMISTDSDHLDDLATVNEAIEAECIDVAVRVLSVQQLIPPTEEEVTSDEFEPWGERVACSGQ